MKKNERENCVITLMMIQEQVKESDKIRKKEMRDNLDDKREQIQ